MERGKFESYGLIVGVIIFLVVAVYYFLGSFTGYAVFGEGGSGDNYMTIGIVLVFLVFAFFIVRRILRHRLKHKIKKKRK